MKTCSVSPKPSEIIKEKMEGNGITIRDFIRKTGITEEKAKDIIEGRKCIGNKEAEILEKVFGVDSKIWLHYQNDYRESLSNYKRFLMAKCAVFLMDPYKEREDLEEVIYIKNKRGGNTDVSYDEYEYLLKDEGNNFFLCSIAQYYPDNIEIETLVVPSDGKILKWLDNVYKKDLITDLEFKEVENILKNSIYKNNLGEAS